MCCDVAGVVSREKLHAFRYNHATGERLPEPLCSQGDSFSV